MLQNTLCKSRLRSGNRGPTRRFRDCFFFVTSLFEREDALPTVLHADDDPQPCYEERRFMPSTATSTCCATISGRQIFDSAEESCEDDVEGVNDANREVTTY